MAARHWMMRSLLIGGILFSPTMVAAGEPEYVSIQTLLSSQAASYQHHMVTVQGVASNIKIIPETSPPTRKKRCVLVYGQRGLPWTMRPARC